MHEPYDVIIIGTGAGGLLARIEADGDRTMGRFRDAFGGVSAPHLGQVLNDRPG
jgi:pyruvate/2-oxoglutarate dehydrogenase complex dihydrolipoamide dehydrogenase (E3) component